MGVNKVIYYGEVLVDMSQVTVTPETLMKGETALDASGELITGTCEGGAKVETVTGTISLYHTADPADMSGLVGYVNSKLEFVWELIPMDGTPLTIEIPKSSLLVLEDTAKSFSGCDWAIHGRGSFMGFTDGFNIQVR